MQPSSASKTLPAVLFALGGLILLSGSFALGVNIGERKSRHFDNWSRNYGRMMMNWRRDAPNPHGAFGKILSVSDSTLVIQDNNNVEQGVIMTSSTVIRIGRDHGSVTDLGPEINVAVFGRPNDQGQIEASLIRIFPSR